MNGALPAGVHVLPQRLRRAGSLTCIGPRHVIQTGILAIVHGDDVHKIDGAIEITDTAVDIICYIDDYTMWIIPQRKCSGVAYMYAVGCWHTDTPWAATSRHASIDKNARGSNARSGESKRTARYYSSTGTAWFLAILRAGLWRRECAC
jgi:hypothetical protein